ncbi:MAG: VCBS repeat-containing protein [Phaeodactylibacter sp.]|nr:VCBS repeat-containing protein [Phaeodactylibacter sp.]
MAIRIPVLIAFCCCYLYSFSQFRERQFIDGAVHNIASLERYDLNLDGKEDLVVAGRDGVAWLENRENGTGISFGPQKVLSAGFAQFFSSVKIADLNADGWPDLVAASANNDRILYFESLGGHAFAEGVLISESANNPVMIDTGDIDGDGDMDIVAYNQFDGEIVAYKNSNAVPGNFSGATLLVEPIPVLYHVSLCDCDEDGDLDILYASNVGLIKCYENDGNGVFPSWLSVSVGQLSSAEFRNIVRTDLDGDGDKDVVAYYNVDGRPIVWMENLGAGEYAATQELVTDQPGFIGMEAADVDNDGRPDLIGRPFDDSPWVWYKNEGGNNFSPPQLLLDNQTFNGAFTFADFDNDGQIDLARANLFKIVINAGDGTGRFFADEEAYSGAVNNLDISSGDLDGDGLSDILVPSRGSGVLSWYKNLSNGHFSEQAILSKLDVLYSAYPADLDGDGDLDIASASEELGVAIHQNLGGGQFAPPVSLGGNAKLVSSADLDGDGDLDILAGETAAWYENLGDLSFAGQVYLNIGFITLVKCYPADVDLDGDLDIVGGDLNSNKVSWLENTGATPYPIRIVDDSFDSPFNIFPHDFNGDGYPDLLVSSRDDGKVSRYVNNGDGTFQDEEVLFIGIDYPRETFVADLDNDGDGEVITNAPDDRLMMFFGNQGNGSFSAREILDEGVFTYKTIAVDLDNDNDLDLVSAGSDGFIRWYENQTFNIGANIVQGNVFWDENENGARDNGEVLLTNFPVQLSPNAAQTYTSANNDNNYRFFLDEGDYTLIPGLASCWELTTTPAQYEFSIAEDSPPLQEDFTFGLRPVGDDKAITLSLTAAAPTRCGFRVPFYLNIQNEGCVPVDGRFGLYPGELATFFQAVPPPDMVDNDTLFWNYSNLYPYEERKAYLELTVAGPAAIGEYIEIPTVAYLESSPGNLTPSDEYQFRSEIRCAYDPNDKLVEPRRSEEGFYNQNFTLFSEELDYTVRFQNTGNDTAFTVVIRDFLSAELDWSTFKPGASSHDYSVLLDSSGLVTFTFENILLPDSTTNEPASHGFVRFSILADQGLANYTPVRNSVGIYFDFNPPIFTNSVENIMVASLPLPVSPAFSFLLNELEASFQDESQNEPTSWLWEFGDGQSSSTQNPTHTYAAAGNYEVCLTATNLVSSDVHCEQITLTVTGSREQEERGAYQVMPNPTTGRTALILPYPIKPEASFYLFDAAGKTRKVSHEATENQILFDASPLPSGIWFFKIQQSEGVFFGKFLVD